MKPLIILQCNIINIINIKHFSLSVVRHTKLVNVLTIASKIE